MLSPALALFVLSALQASPPPAGAVDLLHGVVTEPATNLLLDAPVRRGARAVVDLELLSSRGLPGTPPALVRFAPFGDVDYVFRADLDPSTARAATSWSGVRVSGPASDGDGTAQFTWRDGAVEGSVRVGRRLWKVHGLAGFPAAIEEIDEARVPPCLVTRREAVAAPSSGTVTGASAALVVGHPTIDVMVVYPPSAVAAQGGLSAMEALVDLAILETNEAYRQSGVTQRVRLVHQAELVGYTATTNHGLELAHLQSPADGFIDQVHAWRDQCGADAVVMIADAAGSSCGIAFLMGTTDPGFAPLAFAVVSRTCATGFYSFGHELGHVMGLTHDRDNASDKVLRVSYSSSLQGGNAASHSPAVAALARFAACASDASNLVTGDANGARDVFLRDRQNYATTRVSVATGGTEANGPSDAPAVSQSGVVIAFQSSATNLDAADTNGFDDVFVHDTTSTTTTRVSVSSGGAQGNGASSEPALSDDGRFVAFTSTATNLVAGGSGQQIHVRDRVAGTTTLASVSTAGALGNGPSSGASISADGRFVAFTSTATNLVANDTNGAADVFLRDRVNGTTTLVSVATGGAPGNGASSGRPWIAAAGGHVVFASLATNLVGGDTNGTWDVFVRDLTAGTTTRASVDDAGAQANGPSGWLARPTITSDGRYVAFASRATNLVAGDTNGSDDVFVRDRVAGTTSRVSVTPSGSQRVGASGAVDASTTTAIATGNADAVVFTTSAQLEILDGNSIQDVYAYQFSDPNPSGADAWSFGFRTADDVFRTIMAYAPGVRIQRFSNPSVTWSGYAMGIAHPSPYSAECWRTLNGTAATVTGFRASVFTSYCSGEGTGTACPCGNASPADSGAGCANSLGLYGELDVRGTASLAHDTVRLIGAGMPDGPALYFQGTSPVASGAGTVFGDGLRCVGGSVTRLAVVTNAGHASSFPPGAGLASLAGVLAPGARHYQVWYRDAAAFCTVSTFNLTNAATVQWQP